MSGAQLMASALGVPGYGFAVIGHPISSAGSETLAARALVTLQQAGDLVLRRCDETAFEMGTGRG